MGWCSGTEIFDSVVGPLLKLDIPKKKKKDIIYNLAVAMENQDWDSQSESDYWKNPIVQEVFAELHEDPHWMDEE